MNSQNVSNPLASAILAACTLSKAENTTTTIYRFSFFKYTYKTFQTPLHLRFYLVAKLPHLHLRFRPPGHAPKPKRTPLQSIDCAFPKKTQNISTPLASAISEAVTSPQTKKDTQSADPNRKQPKLSKLANLASPHNQRIRFAALRKFS